MLYIFGFFFIFVAGGLTGVMLAIVPFDWQAHDSYFIVAHLHYVTAGAAPFPMLAALYYWLPLLTGRTAVHRLSVPAFWLILVGFNLTFFLMHLAGLLGMPRRIYTYSGDEGWIWINLLSSVGGFIMTIGFALVAIDLLAQIRYGRRVRRNPWGAATLEWAMPIPPTPYSFASIPNLRTAPDRTSPDGLALSLARGEGYLGFVTQWLAGDARRAYDVRRARADHRASPPDISAALHGARSGRSISGSPRRIGRRRRRLRQRSGSPSASSRPSLSRRRRFAGRCAHSPLMA